MFEDGGVVVDQPFTLIRFHISHKRFDVVALDRDPQKVMPALGAQRLNLCLAPVVVERETDFVGDLIVGHLLTAGGEVYLEGLVHRVSYALS